MSALIEDYTFASVTEIGAEISNSQIIRKLLPATWSKARVAVRLSVLQDSGAAPTSGAVFAFGLCSGSTACLGDATPAHVVGFGNYTGAGAVQALTRGVGGTNGFSFSTGANVFAFKFVNGVFTASSAHQGTPITTGVISAPAAFYTCFHWLTITKGSPNWTFSHGNVTNFTFNSAATFIAEMESATPAPVNHVTQADVTIPVNEGTNGTLDHFNLWWNRSAPTVFVHDVAVIKLLA